MKLKPTLLAFAAAAAFAGSAQALVVTGTTTGGPTFNRPFTTTALSSVGTAVPYSTLTFTVSTAGSYAFLSTATGGWDNFTLLYTAFNPTASLSNLLILNDDVSGVGTTSGFSFTLSASTSYTFVTTGYANTDFGAYTTSITGPGTVTVSAVPEPSSYAMLALGLAGIGAVARRRNAG